MAGTTSKTAAAKPKQDKDEAPKRKRTVLSGEEKIAKLEADLASAREREQAKREKKRDDLVEKRDSKQAKVDKLRAEIAELDRDIELHGPAGEPIVPIDDGGALSQVSGDEPATEGDDEE